MLGSLLGGRYELIERIGCGGMAIVYKAKCHLLSRYVAVKVLRPELVEDEEFVLRFKRESQSVASLSHPNIVNVYDVGEDNGIYYIVMEYVNGSTLKEYIKKKGKIEPLEVVMIALQISSAIKHAHENGIMHRDIKPQNILIGEDGSIKVADFGIARAITSATITMAGDKVMGSVHYFSPEQARGGYVDTKSDIYSLGIVLYEMSTGIVPFDGDSAVSVALKHIQEQAIPSGEINPDIPGSMQDIIKKSIEKEQCNRYQNISEMIVDLERVPGEPDGNFVCMRINSDLPTQTIMLTINKQNKMPNTFLKLTVIISLIIVLFSLAAYIGNRVYRQHLALDEIEVPNIEGFLEQDAENLLNKSNLFIRVTGRQNSEQLEEGRIISQEPDVGISVRRYTFVNVVISSGPRTIFVPNFIGQLLRDAELTIANIGLRMREPEFVDSNFPSGTVIRQSVLPETAVDYDSIITLTVSRGPSIRLVEVANYTGLRQEVATKLIVNDSLEVGQIFTEHSAQVATGVVIKQQPVSGDMVEEKHKVDLWVSLGPMISYPRRLEITLPQEFGTDILHVRLERKVDGYVVYQAEPFASEGSVYVDLDETGIVVYRLYINDIFQREIEVDFTKKEDVI